MEYNTHNERDSRCARKRAEPCPERNANAEEREQGAVDGDREEALPAEHLWRSREDTKSGVISGGRMSDRENNA